MFGEYSIGDLGSIFVMQGFAGLILFSVYVLMALGLAIIFGQMGVINMAHGEFMILGAYVTWMTSNLFQTYLPGLFSGYFFGTFAWVERHFEAVLVAIVIISVLPMAWELLRARRAVKRGGDGVLAATTIGERAGKM